MKHIIFDFDGVIIDSFKFHIKKMNEIYNRDLTEEEYSNRHTGNFYENPSEKFEGIDYSDYAKKVSEDQSNLTPNPDSIELLKELSTKFHLHIITSGWKVQVMPFFEKHNIVNLFDNFLLAEDGKKKSDKFNILFKKGISSEDCIFVTDTLGDLYESNHVGVKTIAVDFGYHSAELLKKGEPNYIVSSFNEMRPIFDSFIKS
tara:strand:+ start:66 stop:671 length:606 start_codon:yes stop_codon:yes gene_type:complete